MVAEGAPSENLFEPDSDIYLYHVVGGDLTQIRRPVDEACLLRFEGVLVKLLLNSLNPVEGEPFVTQQFGGDYLRGFLHVAPKSRVEQQVLPLSLKRGVDSSGERVTLGRRDGRGERAGDLCGREPVVGGACCADVRIHTS